MVFLPVPPIRWSKRPQRKPPPEKVAESTGMVNNELDLATQFYIYAMQKVGEPLVRPQQHEIVNLIKPLTDAMAQEALAQSAKSGLGFPHHICMATAH